MRSGFPILSTAAFLMTGCAPVQALPQAAASRPPIMQPVFARSAAAEPISTTVTTAARLLAAHNMHRAAAGVPPLLWDPALAASAAAYGPALAARGDLVHSPRAGRPGVGENLWMGSAGAYSPEAMVGNWAEERAQFRAGIFPAVSTTGNWLDVSHYTQMIWRSTTRVGCAVHRQGRWDYLICHYSPKGNRDGQRVP